MPSAFERACGPSERGDEDAMEIDPAPVVDEEVRLSVANWAKVPSHALPSVAVLCTSLLDQIVDKKART